MCKRRECVHKAVAKKTNSHTTRKFKSVYIAPITIIYTAKCLILDINFRLTRIRRRHEISVTSSTDFLKIFIIEEVIGSTCSTYIKSTDIDNCSQVRNQTTFNTLMVSEAFETSCMLIVQVCGNITNISISTKNQ